MSTEEDKQQELKEKEISDKLQAWKNKLNTAMSSHDGFRAAASEWDAKYNGSKKVDSRGMYMSDRETDQGDTKDARQVVNVIFQLIESQIDTNIPVPRVDALEAEDEENKDMIEGMLTYISSGTELERINSENERISKKNSLCCYKVVYDNNYKGHSWNGRIKTFNPHPINIIPQPNVNKIEDMDYIFCVETRTLDYVCRTYGEQFRSELEEKSAEFNYLENFGSSNKTGSEKGQLSIIECWYKDVDGDICKLTWCNDTILDDVPKYYYKRDEQGNIQDTETLTIDIADPITGEAKKQEITVKSHIPTRFPIIIQYNIPREKSYYGVSDPFIISDQQEGIKKMLSMQEEKLVKGTTKIFARKGMGLVKKINNATTQIIEVDDPKSDIVIADLKTPDNSLIEQYDIYTQAAKDTVGITEASQGRAENANLSGKALETLASYTQGRISVKTFEKNLAFKELYRLYFDFLLAFYDDKIPYKIEGKDNKAQYGYFDKTKLLKQDAAEEYYYPDFDIYISADAGIPKDKMFIINSAKELFQAQGMDSVGLWTILESVGYPNAGIILDMEKQKQQIAQQQAQMQAQMQQVQTQANAVNDPDAIIQQEIDSLPPDQKEYLLSLPEDKRQDILAQFMQQMGDNEQSNQ